MKTILLLDNEDQCRKRLARDFSARGYKVFSVAAYEDGVRIVDDFKPDMAVVELKMPGRNGMRFVQHARKLHSDIRIIVLTGYGSIANATLAMRLGALSYLTKPTEIDELLKAFSEDPGLGIEIDRHDMPPPSLARVEWEHISRILSDCGGNISAAAKQLGIHRRTLQRKLHKYPPTR